MSFGIGSLHKVLKDKTRRKTILLLQEKGSLNYVDLMKALEIGNTGKMNYHLRIPSDLLSKNETGQYTLTEKGRLALRLLREFPKDNWQLYKQWVPTILAIYIILVLVMGYLVLNPQHIQQFFFVTLIAVAVGLFLLALLALSQKFRGRFLEFLTNYRARTRKTGWSLYRKAQLFNAIMLAMILAFSVIYSYNPSILGSPSYFPYVFVALFIVFLISAIIFVGALLKTFWKWGLVLIIIGVVIAILRILTMR